MWPLSRTGKRLRLADVLIELLDKALLLHRQLVLGAVALRLEPLGALDHLRLDLGRPAPSLTDHTELLCLEADRLLD